jgi:hypothetical protein
VGEAGGYGRVKLNLLIKLILLTSHVTVATVATVVALLAARERAAETGIPDKRDRQKRD